jgi:hypothetical protein
VVFGEADGVVYKSPSPLHDSCLCLYGYCFFAYVATDGAQCSSCDEWVGNREMLGGEGAALARVVC